MSARGGEGGFSDPRTEDERARDREAVSRQTELLGRCGKGGSGLRTSLNDAVLARRQGRGDLEQFEVLRLPGGASEVSVVSGEMLMRAVAEQQDPKVWAMVHHFFGTDPEPVAGLDGRVVRWRSPDVGVRKLRDFARVVRAAGFEASVNHVAPLGPVVKAGTGPEQTSMGSPPPFGGRVESAGPRVAVIDTGITSQVRPDGWLSGVERREGSNIDGLTLLPSPEDRFLDFAAGHGTFAAGIVAQVAPAAEVAAYAAVDTDGIGSEVCIGEAMVEAAREGASILNLSLGGPTLDNQPLLAIEVALDIINEIERDEQREILVVAAAGNDGVKRPCWPAASRRVVSVAALTAAMTPARWSNSGFWVDCSTVGEGIVSTYVKGEESPELDPSPDTWDTEDAWALWSGTSFAAPQVAGKVASLCSSSGLTPREALATLLGGGRHLPDFGRAVRIMPGT